MMPPDLNLPAYRIPAAFDVRQSDICLFADWESNSFVKLVYPKRVENHDPVLYGRMLDDAQSLWQQKYGAPMPEDVECCPVEVVSASGIPHEGPTELTITEWNWVESLAGRCDLTLDMLWFVVEGLKWRPGQPVSETDPLWPLVFELEESTGAGSTEIVRALLGMPRLDLVSEKAWMSTFGAAS